MEPRTFIIVFTRDRH